VDRKAISITQACQSVGVSRRTIYNWMAAGKVEYVRTAGGAVRIFEDTLWREPQQQPLSSVTYRATDTAADRGRVERI
jgi:excisionase family DNA binding protein